MTCEKSCREIGGSKTDDLSLELASTSEHESSLEDYIDLDQAAFVLLETSFENGEDEFEGQPKLALALVLSCILFLGNLESPFVHQPHPKEQYFKISIESPDQSVHGNERIK